METSTATKLFESFRYFDRLLPKVARTGIFSLAAQKYAREQTGFARAAYRPRATVTACRSETVDTISLYLLLPPDYPTYQPGQHIDVAVEINGTRHVRQYSITGAHGCTKGGVAKNGIRATPSSAADAMLRITIKRQKGGLVSQFIHDNIAVGASFEISAPRGTFTLPETEASAYVFCSAGSGITPVFAMVHSLLATDVKADVHFYHAARSADAVIFQAELDYLAEQHENFYPYFFLSESADSEIKRSEHMDLRGLSSTLGAVSRRPERKEAQGLRSARGASARRLNFDGLQSLLPPTAEIKNAAVFLCGPGEFVKDLEIGFADLGFANIKTEYYTLPKMESGEGIAHFRNAGTTATAQGNLLEAAEAVGLKPKHGCRRGICHECKAHKRIGTVRNILTGKLTSGEEDIQLCISQPVGAVELDL